MTNMAQSRRNSTADTKSTNVVLEKPTFRVHAETLSQLEAAQTLQPEVYSVDILLKLFAAFRLILLLFSISIIGFDTAVITHAHDGGAWELPWIFVVSGPLRPRTLHRAVTADRISVPPLGLLERSRLLPPHPPHRHLLRPRASRIARRNRLDRGVLPLPVCDHDGAR